jgi:D-3-phosphoglycerate dehydrogenase
MLNVLISNIGFGDASPHALALIRQKAQVVENHAKHRFSEDDFISRMSDTHILIAGTEKISRRVLEQAPNLKLISRVGVGVDNIDLDYAKERRINVVYTPQAPSEAVPEFTLSLILNLIKGISRADHQMHNGTWFRPMGRMLSSMKIGIVGAGKIGSKVIDLIKAIAPSTEILFYDPYLDFHANAEKCDLSTLLKKSDIVSLHLPLSAATTNLLDANELSQMKSGSYLINTSRGGIVNEEALYLNLHSKHLAGAALDVFEVEPYNGKLAELDNCLLTSHIGSLTHEVRALMENQVAEDVVCFIENKPLIRALEGFNFGE